MTRHPVLLAVLAAAVLVAAGCESTTNEAAVEVHIVNIPSIVGLGQSVSLTAIVLNDDSDAGVDWSCSGAATGTFDPPHTASGGKTVFTAPATASALTITATSTAEADMQESVDISAIAAVGNVLLNGRYVFQVQGTDSNGSYAAVGTIIADGAGNITGGRQDIADETGQTGPDALTGTYAVSSDGRGSLTLDVSSSNLPNYGVETFSIAVTSPTHALIIQFDGTATSSGTLDFQSADALEAGSIIGAYVFTAGGIDIPSNAPLSFGGVTQLSAATGTLASGTLYENDGGDLSSSAFTGTMTGPDAYGRGTIETSLGVGFVYYAVQGGLLRLVEEDVPTFITGGTMCAQGPDGDAGTFTNAALDGDYSLTSGGASVFGAVALASQFTADGTGSLTDGFADVNDGGSLGSGSIAGLDAYTIAGDGTGTLTLPGGDITQNISSLMIFVTDPALNLLDPGSATGGGGALILDFDASALGTGIIVPRSAGMFQGFYSFGMQTVGSDGEVDFVGRVASDGVGSLAGTVDVNINGTALPLAGISGTFTADPVVIGRFTGTYILGGTTHEIVYYMVSGASLFVLDIDTADVGIGGIESGG
jgi:hypothetical protein